MNNLDHVKNFYPDNYKLDLSETMKAALSKGPNVAAGSGAGVGVGGATSATAMVASNADLLTQSNANMPGEGYVTEKLYMLLQLYLQNKGWNPSAELLQCFTDLKDSAMLPSAAYLQVLANRLTLDTQGRLILRDNGKIVLPFEHFANAVMLKHMSGPHGLHLSVDATVRAVIESYTIGRDQFGMEKEFIIEVVQSCPSPACRYYKNHMGISPLPFMDQQFPSVNTSDFLQHLQHLPHLPPPPPPPPHQLVGNSSGSSGTSGSSAATNVSTGVVSVGASSGSGTVSSSNGGNSSNGGGGSVSGIELDLSKTAAAAAQSKVPSQLHHLTKQQQNSIQSQLSQISAAAAAAHHQQQMQQQQQQAAQQQQQQQQQHHQAAAVKHQQQLTAALIQQQNRVLAQQSLEKFSNLSTLEKQRILAQLDPKHFDPMAVAAAAANLQIQGLIQTQASGVTVGNPSSSSSTTTSSSSSSTAAVVGSVAVNAISATVAPAAVAAVNNNNSNNNNLTAVHAHGHQLPPPAQSPHSSSSSSSHSSMEQLAHKNVESLRPNIDSLESNKDLLALHNGAWGSAQDTNRAATSIAAADLMPIGQDKIVRVFTELMRNMARMKNYIRPSMCKPYGKQSESLQKTLMDTIQIVQTLRNCLPAPHIPVTSWKSESEGSGMNVGISVGNASLSLAANGSLTLGTSLPTLGLQAPRVDNMH